MNKTTTHTVKLNLIAALLVAAAWLLPTSAFAEKQDLAGSSQAAAISNAAIRFSFTV